MGMEGAIVREIVICFIDTLLVGTLLSAMISPVHKAIGELVPQLEIVKHPEISFVIMAENGIDLRVGIWFRVRAVERSL